MTTRFNVQAIRFFKTCLTGCFLLFYSLVSIAADWPQELTGKKGTIVVYQPQPEKLVGNILTGRAAMSLELKDNVEPIFGVFWFSSKIETDRSDKHSNN